MKEKITVLKRMAIIIIICSVLFLLTGCENKKNQEVNNVTTNSTSSNNKTNKKENSDMSKKEEKSVEDINYATAAEKQMSKPNTGETVATIKVKDFGDIKVKFFNDVAPKAVENFVTHAKEGYYNGVTFHRVINEFMIQGGDPEGTGRGGESIWGKGFGEELDYEIVPYRGSLCMASAGTGTSTLGSQFFITQANYSENMANYLSQYGYPTELIEQYKNYGGYLSLYLKYTIFGQVFEGMDVVDAIAKVETSKEPQPDKPVNDVVIEKIEVSTYE